MGDPGSHGHQSTNSSHACGHEVSSIPFLLYFIKSMSNKHTFWVGHILALQLVGLSLMVAHLSEDSDLVPKSPLLLQDIRVYGDILSWLSTHSSF